MQLLGKAIKCTYQFRLRHFLSLSKYFPNEKASKGRSQGSDAHYLQGHCQSSSKGTRLRASSKHGLLPPWAFFRLPPHVGPSSSPSDPSILREGYAYSMKNKQNGLFVCYSGTVRWSWSSPLPWRLPSCHHAWGALIHTRGRGASRNFSHKPTLGIFPENQHYTSFLL